MKIISLKASNVKRLKAVEITPSGEVVVVGGRNAQGKSSVLDAIWLALGGGPATKATTRPVRDGEDSASVVLDLGEFVVTRTWSGTKTTLTVATPEGAKFSGPQGILDALVGRLAFDPLEFTRLSAKAQRDALLGLVDLPFDLAAIDQERAALFDERTDVGRRGKAIGDIPDLIPDVPAEEVSSVDILAELRAAQEAVRVNEAAYERTARAQTAREQAAEALRAAVAEEEAALAAFQVMPEVPDAAEIEQRLARVDETNRAVRANAEAREKRTRHEAFVAEYKTLTDKIEWLDKTKADGLAAATFPVPGLGFDESGVTLEGVPFSQASSAEQIRVSLAMAMSLNPRLKVVHIRDGSLLDAGSLALIAGMAAEQDYQVWIERVGDADTGAVIIEDGEVAA